VGLKKTFDDIAKAKRAPVSYERALLAMVANRLCAPESKLGLWDRWLETVYLPSCQGLKLYQMYEAMDMFYDHAGEVDLIFYDTTTASFAVDNEDDPARNPDAMLRCFGSIHSII
ncbi:MAG: transposase, partial [Thermodesulfobacteriota bacterium]|nr:transposase [Thermodesulfobacteriota bacterium]